MRNKPQINEQVIETVLLGKDPQKHIRAVETLTSSNKVFVFSRTEKGVNIQIDENNPFFWVSKLPSIFYSDTVKNFNARDVYKNEQGNTVFLFNNRERIIDNETAIILDTVSTDSGIFYTIWFVLETTFDPTCQKKSDREIILAEKQKEYGIKIKELTTHFDGQTPTERMLKGHKFLYELSSTTLTSSNPIFSKKKKGESKGTNTVLKNYFREGGIASKGELYLDVFEFLKVYNTLEAREKMEIFKMCFLHNIRIFNKSAYKLRELHESKLLKLGVNLEYEKFQQLFFNNNNKHIFEKLERIKGYDKFIDLTLTIEQLIYFKYQAQTFDSNELSDLITTFNRLGFSQCFYKVANPIFSVNSTEQYFIQSGKRIFKDIEYTDIKKMVFDIETEGLNPKTCKTITIAAKIYWSGDKNSTLFFESCVDNEGESILKFFSFIKSEKPDLLLGHNIFDFDFNFLVERLDILGYKREDKKGDMTSLAYIQHFMSDMYDREDFQLSEYGVKPEMFFNISPSIYKAGGATKSYVQYNIFGMSVLDTMIAIDRALAMDKSIPNKRLKDNVKHLKLEKKNRVYVEGSKISTIYKKQTPFLFNEENGHFKEFQDKQSAKTNISFVERSVVLKTKDKQILTVSDVPNEAMFYYDLSNPNDALLNFKKICWEYDLILFPKDFYKHIENAKQHLAELRNFCNNTNLDKFFINSDLKIVSGADIMKSDLNIVSGAYIIERYNIDDLDETAQVDFSYGQNTFEVGKWLPNGYQRSATIGGASNWKMFMCVVSFMYNLAVPLVGEKHGFCGGLQGMFSSGFHGDSVKVDFTSQYPSAYIQYCIENTTDIIGIMKPLLKYGLDKRVQYKGLKNKAKKSGDKSTADFYDRKQLPMKIMLNSFFGALGAPEVFKWAEWQCAQMITASCRAVSRHAIRWFAAKGLPTIYCHTDGINFDLTEECKKYTYTAIGNHSMTTKGETYVGVEAMVMEYNETFFPNMIMGLGVDEYMLGAIYFAKSNFIYAKEGKGGIDITFVGGTLTNKVQNEYIKKYINAALQNVFKNNPQGVVDEYNKAIAEIFANQLTPRQIASKKRTTKSLSEYKERVYAANGDGKQSFMEFFIQNPDFKFEQDSTYYLLNTADKNSKNCTKDIISEKVMFCNLNLNISDAFKFAELMTKTSSKKKLEFGYRERLIELIKKFNSNITTNNTNNLLSLFAEVIEEKSTLNYEDLLRANAISIDYKLCVNGKFKVIPAKNILDFFSTDENVRNKMLEKYEIDNKTKFWKPNQNSVVSVDIRILKYTLNCSLVPEDKVDIIHLYNPMKYLEKLNKTHSNLLIIFDQSIRASMISNDGKPISIPIDKLQFVCGQPLDKKEDKMMTLSSLEELEDGELELWYHYGLSPLYPFDNFVFDKTKKYNVSDSFVITEDENGMDYKDAILKLSKYQFVA